MVWIFKSVFTLRVADSQFKNEIQFNNNFEIFCKSKKLQSSKVTNLKDKSCRKTDLKHDIYHIFFGALSHCTTSIEIE